MTQQLRIATYNFLAGGSAKRATHWHMLQQHVAPDIVLSQECKPPDRKSFRYQSRLWHEAIGGRWGSALVTARMKVAPLQLAGFDGWVTGGELKVKRRPVRVFSVHAPPGKHGYIRTVHEMVDRFKDVARGADLVIGGDFNVAVGFRGPDEQVKMSKAERELFHRFVSELGLIPCWQAANPGKPLAQTLRWTGNRMAPYHCDGIFVPDSWASRLKSCEVIAGPEWDVLSDHNPVVAVFDL